MKKLALLFVFVNYLIFAQGEQRYADGTATDQDGNTFEWISYGYGENSFHWAIENADVVTYNDGTPIPQVLYPTQWSNASGAWCYYNNDPTQVRLYNWAAVTHPRFAPEGWRVASKDDYTLLTDYLENNNYIIEGGIGKAMASTTGWDSSTTGGAPGNDQNLNNRSGFNALPGPYRSSNGDFISGGGYSARFWTSTNYEGGVIDYDAYIFIIGFSSPSISVGRTDKRRGVSVRFVRDAPNDTEAPVITLLGANLFQINQGAVYNDPGATAYDNVDGDISQNIVTNPVNLNTSEAGTFTITYSVSDAAGNSAIPKTRTVNVLDTEPPVITLLGANLIEINQGTTYNEPGATATDNVDGTIPVVISGNVDTSVPGTYTRSYDAVDTAGNTAIQVTRTVNVIENPTVEAGPYLSVCQGEDVTITGATASNYSSLQWESSGDGTIINVSTLTPIYTPGAADIASGAVTLTLTANGTNGQQASDSAVIYITSLPTVNAGRDFAVNEDETIQLSEATAYNYSSFVWTTSGNGTFNATNILNPIYIPSQQETINGSVTLTMTAISYAPCSYEDSDQVTITINPVEINPTETGILLNGV